MGRDQQFTELVFSLKPEIFDIKQKLGIRTTEKWKWQAIVLFFLSCTYSWWALALPCLGSNSKFTTISFSSAKVRARSAYDTVLESLLHSGNAHHLPNILLGIQIQISVGAIEFKYCSWRSGHYGRDQASQKPIASLLKIWPECRQSWSLRLSGIQRTRLSHMGCLENISKHQNISWYIGAGYLEVY